MKLQRAWVFFFLMTISLEVMAQNKTRPQSKSNPSKKTLKSPKTPEEKAKPKRNPWSMGFGIGAISSEGETQISLSADLRYRWNVWTESVVGLDLYLGSLTALGYRLGEKFFVPLKQSFTPFGYLGFRQSDVTDSKSCAYEPGVGFRYQSSSSGYFEVGLHYLIRKPFDNERANIAFLNATSGFSF
jgi:hypothetical protein